MADDLCFLDNVIQRVQPILSPRTENDLVAELKEVRALLVRKNDDIVDCVDWGQRLLVQLEEVREQYGQACAENEQLTQENATVKTTLATLQHERSELVFYLKKEQHRVKQLTLEQTSMFEVIEEQQQHIASQEKMQDALCRELKVVRNGSVRVANLAKPLATDHLQQQVEALKERIRVEEANQNRWVTEGEELLQKLKEKDVTIHTLEEKLRESAELLKSVMRQAETTSAAASCCNFGDFRADSFGIDSLQVDFFRAHSFQSSVNTSSFYCHDSELDPLQEGESLSRHATEYLEDEVKETCEISKPGNIDSRPEIVLTACPKTPLTSSVARLQRASTWTPDSRGLSFVSQDPPGCSFAVKQPLNQTFLYTAVTNRVEEYRKLRSRGRSNSLDITTEVTKSSPAVDMKPLKLVVKPSFEMDTLSPLSPPHSSQPIESAPATSVSVLKQGTLKPDRLRPPLSPVWPTKTFDTPSSPYKLATTLPNSYNLPVEQVCTGVPLTGDTHTKLLLADSLTKLPPFSSPTKIPSLSLHSPRTASDEYFEKRRRVRSSTLGDMCRAQVESPRNVEIFSPRPSPRLCMSEGTTPRNQAELVASLFSNNPIKAKFGDLTSATPAPVNAWSNVLDQPEVCQASEKLPRELSAVSSEGTIEEFICPLIQEITSQREQAVTRAELLALEMETARETIAELQQQNEKLKHLASSDQAESKVECLKLEIAAAQETIAKLQEENKKLQESVPSDDGRAHLAELRCEVTVLNGALSAHNQRRRKNDEVVADLKRQLEESNKTIQDLQEDLERLSCKTVHFAETAEVLDPQDGISIVTISDSSQSSGPDFMMERFLDRCDTESEDLTELSSDDEDTQSLSGFSDDRDFHEVSSITSTESPAEGKSISEEISVSMETPMTKSAPKSKVSWWSSMFSLNRKHESKVKYMRAHNTVNFDIFGEDLTKLVVSI